jgi:hypothetical protein
MMTYIFLILDCATIKCVINIMRRCTPWKRCSYEGCPFQAISYGRCYNHSDRKRPDRQICRTPRCNSIVLRQWQCRLHRTWGIIPALVGHPVAIPPVAALGGQLPVTCHPVAIPEARDGDGDPVDPLIAVIHPSTNVMSVNSATAGGQLRVICPPVAIPEEQDRHPADPSTAMICPSTNVTLVNSASAG